MTMRVQGLAELRSRLKEKIPEIVISEIADQLEKEAEKLVQMMNAEKPKGLDGLPIDKITLGWTWGDAPRGAITVGRVANREYPKIGVRIFAATPQGSGFSARFFEFGTLPRFHKSGKYTGVLPAQPFFFPTYRERRRHIRRNITNAIKRGIKKA